MPRSIVSLCSFRKLQSSQTLRNQQHGIGTGHTSFQQLVGIQDEVFSQQRYVDRGADGFQILKATLEEFNIRQHANTRCTMFGVRFGDRDRIEIIANDAFGWARLL